MPFRCINDKFNYCSGTPKGVKTEVSPATGEQVPGFEFEPNSCKLNFKTCKYHTLWLSLYQSTAPPIPVTEAEKSVAKKITAPTMERMI